MNNLDQILFQNNVIWGHQRQTVKGKMMFYSLTLFFSARLIQFIDLCIPSLAF